jgi:hairy and enhancer of split related with YRPW motif
MDYHIIGFRECASEVARYLVTIEGMDIQDPLRLRLMSHLQCFVAQRELSAKSSTTGVTNSNWSNTYQPNYSTQGYQTYPGTSPVTPHQQQQNQQQNAFNSSYMSASGSSSTYLNSSIVPQSPEYSSSGYGTTANSSTTSATNTSSSSNNALTTSPAPIQTATSEQQQQQQAESQQPIYTDLSNTNDRLLNLGGSYHNYGHANQLYGSANNNGYNNNNNNSKPYRPWHPEMAY